MTDLLDKAITAARNLPPEVQDAIARMVLSYAGEEQAVYRFTPEEEAEQDEADAAEARGDFATDEEVRAIWAKYGL
ncbi:MAG: hypothetical protein ACAH20_04060 [Methylobacteriaceae bacterium]|jgi:hypothetical protein|uniref:Uncharacterized protein n=3 Tax=Methylorubrum extorquens TaxID=408 RepID=C5B2R5_METEA|nr:MULTISPECIES: hypothetical protein [Methylobacteriaceae]KQO92364.1 hypothetical protein ASF36_16670 [Methylobacterium sp. Leaf90]KQO94090.1 hypothetical protein ASF33_15085 [Methylobacterium sp. Leaf92]ACS41945.1 hypothetical protein MexAM1_META1p4309 [Methylorubrum extorquens AM1]EHP83967.1 hypothetical protein MetexDRAFT_6007 [Methylorubrum extorquens DSM 13060]KQQ23355.1 hypothetical protein ASF56_17500 [Methylobacterium sp. Leaf122]